MTRSYFPSLFTIVLAIFFAAPRVHAEPSPSCPPVEVVIYRGAFNVFSLGLDTLAENLKDVGYSTQVLNHCFWRGTISEIAAARQAHPDARLVLIGHSYGADATVRAARVLDGMDIHVDLIVTLETVHNTLVSKNVGWALNVHRSRNLLDYVPIWRGLDLQAECACTQVENIDLRCHSDFQNPILSHMQIPDHPWVHDQILERIQRIRESGTSTGLPRIADGIVYEESSRD